MFFHAYTEELSKTCAAMDCGQIERLTQEIIRVYQEGKQVFILGNGGSAAAASHWVCDFAKGINQPTAKKRLRMFALSDCTATLTAYGNDLSYDQVFSEQLKNFLNPGDLVICLSVSGNSKNLVEGLKTAKELGAVTASLLGDYQGICGQHSDILVEIPSKNYGIVEDIHMSVDHAISQHMKCWIVENEVVS